MSPAVHLIELGDVEIQVEVEGAGPAIVLLHGFTGDASTMSDLTERLAPDHTVIIPNLIGHGGSTGPADRYTVDAMAEQVLGVLDALGRPGPHDVIGYSMGGRVALTVACRFPDHVASLSLIGASAGLATEQERIERRSADEQLADSILEGGLEQFVDGWMANPLFATQARLGAEFLSTARAQRMTNSPEELVRSLRGAGTGTMRPLHDVLDRCAAPVRLIVGRDDAKFRAIAAELAQALPLAAVSTVDDAGHAAHLEQPDAVTAAIHLALDDSVIRCAPISLPLRGSHTTGRGTTTRRDSVLIGLRREGHTGWGEASPLPGWSNEDLPTVTAALTSSGSLTAADSAWESTRDWRHDLVSLPAARAAVAGAALDVDARRRGLPLHRFLADWHPDLTASSAIESLAVNALVSATDPAEVARAVAAHVAAGLTTIKLKVGSGDPAADIERVAAARDAGPDVALRIDANGAWDLDTALTVLAAVADHGVVLCEEPVRGIEEIAAVGRAVDVPVAVDESARSPADLELVAGHADSIAAVVVKPQAFGGPDLAIDAVAAARAAGLEVIVTSMIDSAVGIAHAAHVAAACGLESAHGLATAGMLEVDVAPGLQVIEGRIAMPTEIGLGIGLVSTAAAFRQSA